MVEKFFFFFSKTKVVLGDLNHTATKDNVHSQHYRVFEQFVYPKFSEGIHTFDLRLLKLNGSVKFNEYIRPACLPQSEAEISDVFKEVGWGDTDVRPSPLIHKVSLFRVTNEYCKDYFKWIQHQQKLMKRIDEGTIFCAISAYGGRDICSVSTLFYTNFKGRCGFTGFTLLLFIVIQSYGTKKNTESHRPRLGANALRKDPLHFLWEPI